MTRKRAGYHNFMMRLPDAVWAAVIEESKQSGKSAGQIVTESLCRHYKLKIPAPKKPGRPMKTD